MNEAKEHGVNETPLQSSWTQNVQDEVYRIDFEIENIGERIASSKKRVIWHFVFKNSETIHTIVLEHSRLSGKKRLKVDGKSLYKDEKYTITGPWSYTMYVSDYPVPFTVEIQDIVKTRGVRDHSYAMKVGVIEWIHLAERSNAYAALHSTSLGNPSGESQCGMSSGTGSASGQVFLGSDAATQRDLPGAKMDNRKSSTLATNRNNMLTSRWGRDSYARRVSFHVEEVDGENELTKDRRVTWVFTFGVDGEINKLVLDHSSQGDKYLVLNRREIYRGTYRGSTLDHEVNRTPLWDYSHTMPNDHVLTVHVEERDEKFQYELIINGSHWKDIAETDFILDPDWDPVHSQSKGQVYYRNDALKVSQWEKPIKKRSVVEAPTTLGEEKDGENCGIPLHAATIFTPSSYSKVNSSNGLAKDLIDMGVESALANDPEIVVTAAAAAAADAAEEASSNTVHLMDDLMGLDLSGGK